MAKRVNPPLSTKSSKLKYQLAIFVPSTKFDKKVSPDIYKDRVEETRVFLDKLGGGDTTSRASGGYLMSDDKRLVTEDVTIVETSMDERQYLKSKPKVEKFIKEKRDKWKQDSIGYKFEDDLYIYPKFD